MTEEKIERMVKAFSVTGTILLVVLFLIVGYQTIVIQVAKNRKVKLETQLEQLQQQIDDANTSLDHYRSEDYLLRAAREYHYIFKDDILEGGSQ